jgi:cysteine desulfurase
MFKKRIYLDYASLTPIDPDVMREMKRFSGGNYANPSSLYKEGVSAKKALDDARTRAARTIGAHADEIIFTSGGTEANNLAILGAVEALRAQGMEYRDMHVITSVIEHSSVRECMNYLNEREVTVDAISVDSQGVVLLDELKNKIRPNTVIVSIMMVNNEIGTVEPIREIAKIIRQARATHKENSPFSFQSETSYPLFHTDAAQAFLYEDMNTQKLGVDLLTLDGTKICGPRGAGLLYAKRSTPLRSIIHGGGQEKGMRSGTEALPLSVGLVRALEIGDRGKGEAVRKIAELRTRFVEGLMEMGKGIRINGVGSQGLFPVVSPHILNITIPKIDAEFFILQLDAAGIACSTKSSCLRDEDESYVLKAIGADSRSSIRFSFGRWTTKSDIDRTLKVIRGLLR